jgi:hypothetical protein
MRLAGQILWLAVSVGQFGVADALTLPEQSTSPVASPSRPDDSTTQPGNSLTPSKDESINPVYESAALVLCGGFLLVMAHKVRKAFSTKKAEVVTLNFQPKSPSPKRVSSMSHRAEECFAVSQASSLES